MKTTLAFTVALALALPAGPAMAAALQTSYTVGGGSQLLSTNGGTGDTLFVDGAATGGENDINLASGFATFATVLLPGAGLWDIGDTVSITGVALNVRGNTAAGTFTFDIRQGAGGTGPTGGGGLSSIGTATATYTDTTTDVHYVNFDTPVTFVADANSTSIGINFSNSGQLGLKSWNNNPGNRLQQYNTNNGNTPNKFLAVSVAGKVASIPEPVSMSVAALGLALVASRRRR
ncbi:MAG: hypothetical protein AAGA92_03765 [Planctomycetota bacterium]